MSTMKAQREIVSLNYDGLELMSQGEFSRASVLLQKALDQLDHLYPLDAYSNNDDDDTGLTGSFIVPLNTPLSLKGPVYHDESGSLGLFDRGFFLSLDGMVRNEDSITMRTYLSITLHYNLALCTHLQAITAVNQQASLFDEARTLYQIACGLVDFSLEQRELLLLHFAIMNNLACVNAQLCDLHEAQRWLDDLCFAYWSDATALKKEERAFFLSNMLLNTKYTMHRLVAT